MAKKENERKLEVWMNKELHQRIKVQAAKYDTTITNYIIQTIYANLLRDELLNK